MGVLDRLRIAITSNLNAILTDEDPKKILDQSINDMQEGLARLHQFAAQSMAELDLQEQRYNQSDNKAQEWKKQAILAIQKVDENLARETLRQKTTHDDLAATLKTRLDQQSRQVELLKESIEMQTEMVQLRQTLTQSMATLKCKEAEYNQYILQLQERNRPSLLALQNNDKNLANENLSYKENYVSLAEALKSEVDLQLNQVDTLKKDLMAIGSKISKASSELFSLMRHCPAPFPRQNDGNYEIVVDPELELLRRQIQNLPPKDNC
jgi:phage shock protein A